MRDLIASLVEGAFSAPLRRYARLAAFGALTLAFGLIALGALSLALFLVLQSALGSVGAALTIAGVATLLALLVSIPLWRRPQQPPSQLAALLELALTAGLALLLDARRKPPSGA